MCVLQGVPFTAAYTHASTPHTSELKDFDPKALLYTGFNTLMQHWSARTGYWQEESLADLGMLVKLGHRPTETCTRPHIRNKELTVIHTNGIHKVKVQQCRCTTNQSKANHTIVPEHLQYLQHGWWACTVKEPAAVVTEAALETFHHMSNQSKMAGYDYVKSLERLSSHGVPNLGGVSHD